MDGTLALGDRANHGLTPLPGAVEMLRWARGRRLPYLVFTNGTNRSPAHFAAVLRDAGLDVPDDQMMTPASSAVVMFTRRGYKRVMVLGGEGLAGPLRAAGIEGVPPADARSGSSAEVESIRRLSQRMGSSLEVPFEHVKHVFATATGIMTTSYEFNRVRTR